MKIETVVEIEGEQHFDEDAVSSTANIRWCQDNASWESISAQGYMFCVADYHKGLTPWYEKKFMFEAGCSKAFVSAFHKAIALGPTYVMIEAVD